MVTPKIEQFLVLENPETPCLVVDLDVVLKKYSQFQTAFPRAKIYYAVKANPAAPILEKLVTLGSRFDAASLVEVDRCIAAGAEAKNISYGNTIKKLSDIAAAYNLGIRLFAFDSEEDLKKLEVAAPGASVFCRVLVPNTGALWPLSEKFGCSAEMACELLVKADQCGLEAYGVSFHVGSQQTNVRQWKSAVESMALIFTNLQANGIRLKLLNLGGGFPVRYLHEVPKVDELAFSIKETMAKCFGKEWPAIMLEPGRYITAEAGLLRSEVVLVSKKSHKAEERWVYLDVGKFGGLAETMNEAILYPLRTPKNGSAKGPVIIAGPSCDGVDVLYQKSRYRLPLTLKSGDYVDILCTGAYTASYAAGNFNGFAPLAEYYL